MNIVFLGSAQNSCEILESLIENNKNVVLCLTGLSKVGSRGKISVPAVKTLADKHNIFCYQTDNVSSEECIEIIKQYKPDLFITAAFSQFLKSNFLSIAPTINVHPSLLPKYRGATPIQSALINGESKTGVTVLQTILPMDAGDIIVQESVDIKENETYEQLAPRLWKLGKKLVIEAVNLIEQNKVKYIKQNNSEATFCKTFKKEDAKLNFNLDASTLKNQILGYNGWPVSFCYFENKILKIFDASVETDKSVINCFNSKNLGEVVTANKQILIMCKNQTILNVKELQLEGGKRMPANVFLNGKQLNGRLT